MTTPNIEELLKRAKRLRNDLDESNARLDQKCVTAMYEMEQALQSQAERIKELNLQVVSAFGQAQEALEERDALRAQLAALQVDDELPEPVIIDRHIPTNIVVRGYTADQMRQAQATVRAKMVPLEKDAARYRWLRDSEWEMFRDSWLCECHIYGEGPDQLDAAIDAAMDITGEPK